MNQKDKSNQVDEGVNPGQKIKKIALRLSISDSMANEIKRAFDLAKSSGQELDLTFSHSTV